MLLGERFMAFKTRAREVAVIGDNFMLPEKFEQSIRDACEEALEIRTMCLPFPDESMEHGIDGLQEYQGDPEKIVEFVGRAELLVTHLAPVSAQMLDQMSNLKMIAVARGGPINIDVPAARQRGIRVCNSPGRNASAVAEFTVGAILVETRRIRLGHETMRKGVWRGDLYRADRASRELSEMTVGLIGYGQVGARVVRLLKPFGCRMLVNRPHTQISEQEGLDGVKQVSLEHLLRESDVVSLHARMTSKTVKLIGPKQLALMKRGAYFINTARGPLVDYDALYAALASSHLSGAMLDTFAKEPVPTDCPLLQLSNVTLTPHIAGASVKTIAVSAQDAAEEVRRYLSGLPPLHPC
jgi:D-3-phosphoglycerate dehydrogenase / 2-oxoglutarate reductase